MSTQVSVGKDGTVRYGTSTGTTRTGGTKYKWSVIGRVEKVAARKWIARDENGRHVSTCETRRTAVSDLRWAAIDRSERRRWQVEQ